MALSDVQMFAKDDTLKCNSSWRTVGRGQPDFSEDFSHKIILTINRRASYKPSKYFIKAFLEQCSRPFRKQFHPC